MNDNTYDWDTEFQKICIERNSKTVQRLILDGSVFTGCTFIGSESQYEELEKLIERSHLLEVARNNKSETLWDRLFSALKRILGIGGIK